MHGSRPFLFVVSPRIVPFSFEEPIFAGQSAQVTCLVSEGDAPIHFSWQLSGKQIPKNQGIEIQSLGRRGSNLMIESAESKHGGNYTCTVNNTAGAVQYTTMLNVHGNWMNVWSFLSLVDMFVPFSVCYSLHPPPNHYSVCLPILE